MVVFEDFIWNSSEEFTANTPRTCTFLATAGITFWIDDCIWQFIFSLNSWTRSFFCSPSHLQCLCTSISWSRRSHFRDHFDQWNNFYNFKVISSRIWSHYTSEKCGILLSLHNSDQMFLVVITDIHNTRHFQLNWSEQLQECCWVWVQQGLVPFRDVWLSFHKMNFNIN